MSHTKSFIKTHEYVLASFEIEMEEMGSGGWDAEINQLKGFKRTANDERHSTLLPDATKFSYSLHGLQSNKAIAWPLFSQRITVERARRIKVNCD